jgi:hypothetical protein
MNTAVTESTMVVLASVFGALVLGSIVRLASETSPASATAQLWKESARLVGLNP